MFSIYSTLYLVNQNQFNYAAALKNFSRFADEVIISTCKIGIIDGTLDSLNQCIVDNKLNNVKIFVTDINLNHPLFDGQLKDFALKQCTQEFCILLDGDERISLNQKSRWIDYTNYLINSGYDAVALPSLNLCKTKNHVKDIGLKPYLHKREGMNRGVPNYAKLPNGNISIELSDSTELISNTSELAKIIWPNQNYTPDLIKRYSIPCVYHVGWIDSQKRELINRFWLPVWSARAGYEVTNIMTDKNQLDAIPVYEHNLDLWEDSDLE